MSFIDCNKILTFHHFDQQIHNLLGSIKITIKQMTHILSVLIILFTVSQALHILNPNTDSHLLETNRYIHDFYALEDTSIVSKSNSIVGMNQCKDKCLKMGSNFPFSFKYHRYIRRKTTGLSKYFEGTCHFALQGNIEKWYPWSKMKIFIVDTKLFPDLNELRIYEDYQRQCEDTTLKLDEETVEALGYKLVHSNFQYFDDGSFKNLQPFQDLSGMLGSLTSKLGL